MGARTPAKLSRQWPGLPRTEGRKTLRLSGLRMWRDQWRWDPPLLDLGRGRNGAGEGRWHPQWVGMDLSDPMAACLVLLGRKFALPKA